MADATNNRKASPAEVLLTRTAQGVWLDADARELVLAEIALLRHELREASKTAERLQRDADVAAGWLAVLMRAATICPECKQPPSAHRRGCDLNEAWLWFSPVSAAEGDTPPSHQVTDTGDVLTAEEDASAGAWLAYLEEDEAGRFAGAVFDLPPPATKLLPPSALEGAASIWPRWGRTDARAAWHLWGSEDAAEALCGETTDATALWLDEGTGIDREEACLDCMDIQAVHLPAPQAPSGEAPRTDASAGAQDAPTPPPAKCNARNRRGGALCTRPVKANGRCGRHPLREGEAQANA